MQAFTILILEDEPTIANNLKEIAEENNYNVFRAITSKQAFDYLKDHTPHLALLDIKLEGDEHNGFDIAKAIAQKKKNTPIVFLTAYAEDEEIQQKAQKIKGYAGILQKASFDLEENLIELIEEAVEDYLRRLEEEEIYRELIIGSEDSIIINTLVTTKEIDENDPKKKIDRRRRVILSIDEISVIEAIDGKAKFLTDKGVFEVSVSLKYLLEQLQEQLPPSEHNKLCKVHKSYIINPSKIVAIEELNRQMYVYFDVDAISDREGYPAGRLFIEALKDKIKATITTVKKK